MQKKGSQVPKSIKLNDEVISNPHEIANHFNDFFTNIGRNLASKITSNDDPIKLMEVDSPFSMFVKRVDETELGDILSNLKNSAAGSDGIKPSLIKLVKTEIMEPLLFLVNISLKQGVFPDLLKKAVVIPVHKKCCKQTISNYRPVSILPAFSKIFERIMCHRLVEYLEAFKLLYANQFGFRRRHSTDLAIVTVVDSVLKSLEEKNVVLGIFMDLAKAFDTINHSILLRKLQNYGIRGTAHEWFKSYLNCRKQKVKYNEDVYSSEIEITCGVPQGSIIGPILFLLYINDLYKSSNVFKFILFADDTNVFISGKNINDIIKTANIELSKIKRWFDANQLSLNIDKTNYMVFGSKCNGLNNSLKIGGKTLKQVHSTSFLGVHIDDKLTWKKHIEHVNIKVCKSIGILKKLCNTLSKSSLIKLYKCLVLPHINYCNIVWGATHKTSLSNLFISQKKAIKIALHLPKRTPTNLLFERAKLNTINGINKIQTSIFMFKYKFNLLPCGFEGKYTYNSDVHQYHTRQSRCFHLPKISSNRSKMSLYFRGPNLWNMLPQSIQEIPSLQHFKNSVKTFFV